MDGPLAIIMGAEDTGISPALLRLADERVKIPIHGTIQSLNVSVSSALIIYEAIRHRMARQG
jgi:23S rRNA (guanosine2251-2'-O)-methyltransferase